MPRRFEPEGLLRGTPRGAAEDERDEPEEEEGGKECC